MRSDRAGPGEPSAHTDIHWPAGLTPSDADAFQHDEASIDSPPERVFGYLVDVDGWPSWNPQVRWVRTSGRIGPGAMFQIEFRGLRLDAMVGECVPPSRFGWAGTTTDLSMYQAWLLLPTPSGTRVIAEEMAKGATAITNRDGRAAERTRDGHRELLSRLKHVAGQDSGTEPS
ncbi:MAG: hypothetical protein K0R62_4238 [Nonomuraea muscovyensis]|jgi:uncharacterized protein YndB with AHSA1/START domain|nr:hypothetical protein [Nonomuraea muscovyensis]